GSRGQRGYGFHVTAFQADVAQVGEDRRRPFAAAKFHSARAVIADELPSRRNVAHKKRQLPRAWGKCVDGNFIARKIQLESCSDGGRDFPYVGLKLILYLLTNLLPSSNLNRGRNHRSRTSDHGADSDDVRSPGLPCSVRILHPSVVERFSQTRKVDRSLRSPIVPLLAEHPRSWVIFSDATCIQEVRRLADQIGRAHV